jgi:lipopolysaccharide transport system permease protein
LNPLAYMVILTVVFSVLFHVTVQNYAASLLIGLLIWRFFSVGTNQGLGSIVSNPSLVTKVYVPRYLIVLSNNLANFFGATLEFVVLFPLLILLGVHLSLYLLLLPILLVVEFWLVFSLSLFLSSLNLKYRDFNQIWDIALQLGFYVSPIVYNSSLIVAKYHFYYILNPVTGLIDWLRAMLLSNQLPDPFETSVLLLVTFLFFILGWSIFRKIERRFAEEL